MWVFTYKLDADSQITKYKARLVVRGDLQAPTNEDVYASTLAYRTLRILLAIIAYFDWETLQLDAINAFLNSPIRATIYTGLPPGFDQTGMAWLLNKAMYGLRTSPLLWYDDISSKVMALGFTPVPEDPCLFVHRTKPIMVFFYVDDIVIACDKAHVIEMHQVKQGLMDSYRLRELGELQNFLNLQITRDRKARKLWVSQEGYIRKILDKYHASSLRTTRTPMAQSSYKRYEGIATDKDTKQYQEKVGKVIYAAVVTRPDIAYTCSHLSEFLTNPGPQHFQAYDHLLGYLKGAPDLAIEYGGAPEGQETPYDASSIEAWLKQAVRISSDAAYGDCHFTRRSTQGYLITLFGGPIAWQSSKQKTVTTSTTEAELLALSTTAKELLWLERFFRSIKFDPEHPIHVGCDNQQTIGLLTKERPQLQTKLKHIDIHHFWLREQVRDGKVHLQWTPTNTTLADGLTKALPAQKHAHFLKLCNLITIPEHF
jgi:hypothetical protein